MNLLTLAEAEDLFPDAVVLMDVQIPRIIHGEYFELMRTWMGGLCARNGIDSASWHPQVGAWVTCSVYLQTSESAKPMNFGTHMNFGGPATFVVQSIRGNHGRRHDPFVESLNERILQEIKIPMPPFLQLKDLT